MTPELRKAIEEKAEAAANADTRGVTKHDLIRRVFVAGAEAGVELMQAENQRLRTALEFYADKENYYSDDKSRTTGNKCFDIVLFDFDRNLEPKKDYAGKRARAALKGEET